MCDFLMSVTSITWHIFALFVFAFLKHTVEMRFNEFMSSNLQTRIDECAFFSRIQLWPIVLFLSLMFSQSSGSDFSNFDPEFTEEMVPNSICWAQEHSIVNASVMEADDAFVGFSYAPPSDDSFLWNTPNEVFSCLNHCNIFRLKGKVCTMD